MSAKLIIWIPGKPLLNGHKQREFLWSESHRCYVYGGTEIAAEDFNSIYEKAVRNNLDMNPRVRVIAIDAEKPIAQDAPPIPPISMQEITPDEAADQAEEILARLRPDRLKKKTGPKEKTAVMEVA
jgi:hypothetical protein